MLKTILRQIDKAEQDNDRQFVTALARGLGVLSAFQNSGVTLTHQAICEYTGLPKATVSRLIYTLLKTEFLIPDRDGGYRLGMASIQLSATAWAQYDLIRTAQPMMAAFAAENQVSVSLAKEEMGEMLYLASFRSPARLAVQLMVGSKVPIAQTAIGRAYFAVSDALQRETIAQNMQQLMPEAFSSQWHILQQQAEFFRIHGYTLSHGDFSPDILAVAVGVYNRAEARYTHSINASVPASRWHVDEFVHDIAPKLQRLANKISER